MPALLSMLRALPGKPEEVPSVLRGIDEPRFVAQVGVHGLSAIAVAAMRATGLSFAPSAQQQLTRDAAALALGASRQRALLERCLEALAARGVIPAPLKGFGLASRIYEDPLARATTDVDLLLRPSELEAAEEAMRGLGLEPMAPEAARYAREHHHSVNYSAHGQLVELHHRALMSVGHILEADPLLDRSLAGRLGRQAVRWLSPEDEIVYLAAHAAGHAFGRLAWLFDIKLFLLKTTVDWERAVSLARDGHIHAPAYFGLSVAQRAIGAQVPAYALEALRPSRWRAAVVLRMFDDQGLENGRFESLRSAAYVALPMMASDLPAMVRYFRHHFGRDVRRKLAQRFTQVRPRRARG